MTVIINIQNGVNVDILVWDNLIAHLGAVIPYRISPHIKNCIDVISFPLNYHTLGLILIYPIYW